MTGAYYNENDPKAAAWLRELIAAGQIAAGEVDERSIEHVTPNDLSGFRQAHWFAGIGGWSLALRLAGWPDDRPVWTGSCPCQFGSTAARGRNNAPDLWPEFARLIAARSPGIVFGEQVPKASWCDRAARDMEAMGYEFAAVVLTALLVGADHARPRLYFVGHAHGYSKPIRAVDAKMAEFAWSDMQSGRDVRAHGIPATMARRGFGNAIVPQVAAEFIGAVMETNHGATLAWHTRQPGKD